MPFPWPRHPLVYEINTRVLLRELSARVGRPVGLEAIPESELERWAGLGFDALWLMGVWTVGPRPLSHARKPALRAEYQRVLADLREDDIIGSPYAVTRYEVSPDLGGPEALATLRRRMAGHGLRLLLDFVGNHTACDHHLLDELPEAFMPGHKADLTLEVPGAFRSHTRRLVAHGRDPYFPPWTDTAQVNYAHPAAHSAMQEQLQGIADQCDGVRCDMAMLMLPDVIQRTWGERLGPHVTRTSFWAETIPAVRSRHPGFLFLAEVYWDLEARLQQEGFDFTYDKTLYDRLLAGDAAGVRNRLRAPLGSPDAQARFLENHDEARAAEAFGDRAPAAAAVTYLTPGLRLFHEGQLEGWRIKLPVQLGRRPVEPTSLEVKRRYEELLALLRSPAVQAGTFAALETAPSGAGDTSHLQLVAFAWWPPAPPWLVVVANLGPERAYARLALDPTRFRAGVRYSFHDRHDGAPYVREGREVRGRGVFITLEGFQVHLFEIKPELKPR